MAAVLAGPQPRSGREALSDRWIRWVLRRHRAILLVAAVVTVVAGFFAARLKIDGDLRVLLPTDHPVVESLEKIEASFGSTNSVNVVAKGGTADERHAFTDALEARLDGHPLFRDVEHGLPSRFFAERALYYLSDAEMGELEQRIDAWTHYQLCSAEPDACLTAPDERAPAQLRAFIEDKRQRSYEQTGFRERYEREGIEAEVMLVHPHEAANQIDVAREVTTEIRAIASELYAGPGAWSGGSMTYNIIGPYITKADEHDTILRDMVRSGLFAFIGVVSILYFLFRSHRAVLVLLVPLLCGVIWSLAATQLVLGHLNVMTSTISTVVMGVGIDAGIHFFSRVRRARTQYDDGEAIRRAFDGLIVPLLVASSTTIGAFASMASSEFPAFREFGIIAALGVALCLLSMVTVLPALGYMVGIKKRASTRSRGEYSLATRFVLARPGLLFLVLGALSVVALQGARHVQFEYNGRKLQSDRARETGEPDARLISEIFGKDIHASVVVRPTLEEARETLEIARARHAVRKARGDSVVAELFGVTDLLPEPGLDLEARAKEIARLRGEHHTLLEKLRERAGLPPLPPDPDHDGTDDAAWDESEDEDWGAGDDGGELEPEVAPAQASPESDDALSEEDAELLLAMFQAEPFTVDDLPAVLLNKVRASDGSYGLFAYPAFDVADMQRGMVFMEETSSLLDDPDEGIFVGEAVVYAAMFLMLREEAPVVLGMAAVLIAVLVFWQLRSLPLMFMTLVPLIAAMWWLLGLMGTIDHWVDMRFTLFNLPILPAILGIGVDNGVYLTDRIRRSAATSAGLADALQETGAAILAATATTAIGFAAFMVADSGGVRGIGSLAVLGIVLAAMAALLVLPTLTALVQPTRRR